MTYLVTALIAKICMKALKTATTAQVSKLLIGVQFSELVVSEERKAAFI